MNHLRRELAPIGDEVWVQIDDEASRTLRHFLAGRAVLGFNGPKGWDHASEPLGRIEFATPIVDGTESALRVSQPLLEVRVPFTLSLEELERAERGAPDLDLNPVIEAARLAALSEDRAVFHGHEPASIAGVAAVSAHDPVSLSDDYSLYPGAVARAVAKLRRAGVGGPFAIALGDRCYTGVIETTEHGGYPVLEHVRLIVGGPVVWAPAVDGAVVVSVRGGDFEIVCGQDFSIGYRSHRNDQLDFYLEESFTLVVHEPNAAVSLRYEK
jgi:uncharacterized linocin/CFP29 family protein